MIVLRAKNKNGEEEKKKRRMRSGLVSLVSHFCSGQGGWRFRAWQEFNGGGFQPCLSR